MLGCQFLEILKGSNYVQESEISLDSPFSYELRLFQKFQCLVFLKCALLDAGFHCTVVCVIIMPWYDLPSSFSI